MYQALFTHILCILMFYLLTTKLLDSMIILILQMEKLKYNRAKDLVNIFITANKQNQNLILGSWAPEPQI